MKSLRLFAFAAVLCCVSGCATPYQQIGTSVAGGFYSERIAENRFVVSFKGNGFTEPKKARDFALLRAAEVTLEYRYTHFTVDGEGDISHVSTVRLGSTSTTSGVVSPYGGYTGVTNTTYSDMPVFKPGSKLTVSCFEGLPTDKHVGRVFDAALVIAELKEKYKIK